MKILVIIDGTHHSYRASKDITDLQQKEFAPLRTCDDRSVAMVTGELIPGSEAARVIMKTRRDAAKILAEELTEIIIDSMRANDTHNGYKK